MTFELVLKNKCSTVQYPGTVTGVLVLEKMVLISPKLLSLWLAHFSMAEAIATRWHSLGMCTHSIAFLRNRFCSGVACSHLGNS